ncbi:unnamed protein product [Cuscuta epithymum]|uniref:Uncharacterized protein n=1 Tax=Cuscuta epithymum TaxID=186058 RepID=A0AAV0EFW3_9ASTE|nr:unnamed protein product [Cuscuta epithymum]
MASSSPPRLDKFLSCSSPLLLCDEVPNLDLHYQTTLLFPITRLSLDGNSMVTCLLCCSPPLHHRYFMASTTTRLIIDATVSNCKHGLKFLLLPISASMVTSRLICKSDATVGVDNGAGCNGQ